MSRTGTVVEALKTLGPIPKTMRAGVYREKGIVRVEEVPVPEVHDHEVLIKVPACGICGTAIVKAGQKPRLAPGETVLVIGCGPIGLQLLMVSKLQTANLYTSDPIAERRAKSLTLGAIESFDPTNGKLVAAIQAKTEGRGADAVLVAVAHPALVTDALAAARPGGRVLLFAANDPVTKIEFPAAAVGIGEKEILGSYNAAVDIQETAAALVLQKKLPVMDIVTHLLRFDRLQEALELAARPTAQSLKILITHT